MECGEQRFLFALCLPASAQPSPQVARPDASGRRGCWRSHYPDRGAGERSLTGPTRPSTPSSSTQVSHLDAAKEMAQRGLRALADFVASLKIKYQDIEVGPRLGT